MTVGSDGISLTVDEFDEFFAAVNDGYDPFRWQRRLLEFVVQNARWPDYVPAPTGSGKSSVVDIHVFATALAAANNDWPRPPRRLATVVNRRALVDSQYQRACGLWDHLKSAKPGSVVNRVAALLSGLRTERRDGNELNPFDAVLLRGGVSADREWRDDPAACQVMCATPDMWGSRLLFRGYGTTRNARPREAGLLAYDTVAVIDEAHLSRQLVYTARRVSELENVAEKGLSIPTLQVTETTATPTPQERGSESPRSSVGVEPDDLAAGCDEALRARLCNVKRLRVVESTAWPGRLRRLDAYANELAGAVIDLRSKVDGFVSDEQPVATVGCIVNTVPAALRTAKILRDKGFTVETLVGRKRPHDLKKLEFDYPGLLSVKGNSDVDVIVATQTIEVGVDIDLAGLVTEIAPGAALAQRFGRVNRLGRRPDTEIVVLAPESISQKDADFVAPYTVEDLGSAVEWLRTRVQDDSDVSPWRLLEDRPPEAESRRRLLQRPELYDMWLWSRTTNDLFAEPELDLWLRDDVEPDVVAASLVVRKDLPEDDSEVAKLLTATLPVDDEAFPVQLNKLRNLVEQILFHAGDADDDSETNGNGDAKVKWWQRRAFVYRSGEISQLDKPEDLRPGDIVVVDNSHRVHCDGVVSGDPTTRAEDVYDVVDANTRVLDGTRTPCVFRLMAGTCHPELREFFKLAYEFWQRKADLTHDDRLALADVLRNIVIGAERGATYSAAADILCRLKRQTEVVVAIDDDRGEATWLVIRDLQAERDEESRQTSVSHTDKITLTDHAREVAERSAELAHAVGLDALSDVLRLAGEWHDAGKSDSRFQHMLGNTNGADSEPDELLGKSGRRSRQEILRALTGSGLPPGWRHEQLSVVYAAESVGEDADRELILRLVGTSHGRGRPWFPHGSAGLLTSEATERRVDVATRLFDWGEWDALIENTHTRWGVWACAYLEALLRAADTQRSRESRNPRGGDNP